MVDAAPDVLEPQAADVGFESINPARLLDTRPGGVTIDGSFAGSGPLDTSGRIDVHVLGRGGVPANGVDTVVLNVTVNEPTAVGYVTVWPTGSGQPNASNLNFGPGSTVANLVIAKVGAGGNVSFFNSAGRTNIIADVVGFAKSTGIVSVVPARVFDTRGGGATVDGEYARSGPLGANAVRDLAVLGRGGVPSSGVDAVVLNVTVNEPTDVGYLTVWPNGEARPNASNVNFVPGATVPNLVVAKVGTGGAIRFFNSLGDTNVIADVVGYFPSSSAFDALVPARLLDTRPGTATIDGAAVGTGPLAGGKAATLQVVGRGGVPSDEVGTVMLNVTVTNPTAVGYITVWPTGAARPNASNLNFVPGQTVANLLAARVGPDGRVAFFNSAGSTDLLVDVVGWLPPTDTLDVFTFELPPGVVGTPYSSAIEPFGGDAPYAWSSAATQPGLSLGAATGVLSGTPTTAGTVSTPIAVSDSFGRSASRDVGHTVFPTGSGYTALTPTTLTSVTNPTNGSTRTFAAAGVSGVPSDAAGVVLSVFMASITNAYAVVYPAGASMPNSSSATVNSDVGANLAVVQPGSGGNLTMYVGGQALGVVVQVLGYFPAGSSYVGTSPVRVLDTRYTAKVADGAQQTVASGLPVGATAALVSVITTDATAPGSLTAWSGSTIPTSPAFRWHATATATQRFALVPLDTNRDITVRPNGSAVNVIIDVVGYLT